MAEFRSKILVVYIYIEEYIDTGKENGSYYLGFRVKGLLLGFGAQVLGLRVQCLLCRA